jgi:CDGSH-type Zn-finger protein
MTVSKNKPYSDGSFIAAIGIAHAP